MPESPECMGGGHGTVTPACPRQHAVHLTPRWPHGAEVAPYTLPYSRDSMGTAWAQHTLDVATQHDQHQHDQHRGAGLVKRKRPKSRTAAHAQCNPNEPRRTYAHTWPHSPAPPKAGTGCTHTGTVVHAWAAAIAQSCIAVAELGSRRQRAQLNRL